MGRGKCWRGLERVALDVEEPQALDDRIEVRAPRHRGLPVKTTDIQTSKPRIELRTEMVLLASHWCFIARPWLRNAKGFPFVESDLDQAREKN